MLLTHFEYGKLLTEKVVLFLLWISTGIKEPDFVINKICLASVLLKDSLS